jgi:hypothetical protein
MTQQVKSPRSESVLTLSAVLIIGSLVLGSNLLTVGQAHAQKSRNCAMDPVQQSVCIYQAILADVAKTYGQRGGGGISSIVQTSSTTFTVQIAQESRRDLVNYTVKISSDGGVAIVDKTESTQSYR